MYVRGEFNNWGYSDATRMERDGAKYSITMPALNGKFKVGGTAWDCNLGGDANGITISSPVALTCLQNGFNLIASNLSDVTISFTLQRNGAEAKPTVVTFAVGGKNPDDIPIVDNTSGTLPVIHINVYKTDADGLPMLDSNGNKIFDNEITSYDLNHKNYFAGEYWLDTNDCQWMIDLGAKLIGSEDEPLSLEIKARGNWTRTGFSKKPFKIKLGKKQNLLGLTPDKSKHYALLAHADDNYGYLRNFTGFNIGKRIGLPWTPSQQPVEVIINGDYRGLYFLTESIRVGDGRINITELDDLASDPALVSGGYVVELDNYDETNQIRLNEKACIGGHYLDILRVTFDTPEEYSDLQLRFITDQFTAMNDFVGANSDELWSYLDLDDAARYYLAREIVSDVEAYHGSTYLFRDNGQNQKWHFSPIWDCGNAFNGRTDKFFY
ncbi:MAG: CotH kinase family protein, partial [Muribaculaceae bacterium]|nr:CotH kinase family protein [Muribaculaceae bacterium]